MSSLNRAFLTNRAFSTLTVGAVLLAGLSLAGCGSSPQQGASPPTNPSPQSSISGGGQGSGHPAGSGQGGRTAKPSGAHGGRSRNRAALRLDKISYSAAALNQVRTAAKGAGMAGALVPKRGSGSEFSGARVYKSAVSGSPVLQLQYSNFWILVSGKAFSGGGSASSPKKVRLHVGGTKTTGRWITVSNSAGRTGVLSFSAGGLNYEISSRSLSLRTIRGIVHSMRPM